MKRYAFIFVVVCFFISCHGTSPVSDDPDWILQQEDKVLFEQVMQKFGHDRTLTSGELVVKIGMHFLETPYVASTLEKGDTEKLVINLREFDCTTFAENCLALALTIQRKNTGFSTFAKYLEQVRYREGKRSGYPSRLHYFSDWMYDNEQKKIVRSVSKEIAHTIIPNRVNFMSTHTESYPILKRNPGFIAEMAMQEALISQRMAWFIPKDKLAISESQILDGDIIGITTNIEGLDVSHVVIAKKRSDGHLGFIHASSKEHKVVVSDVSLSDYLQQSKMSSGIMVARPL